MHLLKILNSADLISFIIIYVGKKSRPGIVLSGKRPVTDSADCPSAFRRTLDISHGVVRYRIAFVSGCCDDREPYVVVSWWMYNKWHVVVVMVPVWLLVAVTVVLILCDCVTTASLFGCQPSTDSSATSAGSHVVVGRSLSPVNRRATHCRNVYATLLTVLLFLVVLSQHSSSQSTNVYSALEALARIHY